jgi:osmotically-inducible protein OsmY
MLALGGLDAGVPAQPTPAPASLLARQLERLLQAEVPALREMKLDERLGLVTLGGIVPDLPTRREAVALLQSAPGVLHVLDLLLVRTRPRPDRDIEADLLRELELIGPRASAVTARVADGVVRLSGRIDSLGLRSEIDDRAAAVPGVRDLVNELAVDPWAELPPQRLPEDVAWSLPFDSSTVRLVRQGETVILRGVLLSPEQVDRLIQAMLRQPGVSRVISELQVKNPFEKIPGLILPD